MIAPLVAGLRLMAPPAADIAYVARFYYPYPDKRMSRFEVYVSDIHGKNRRQISRCQLEFVGSLQWTSETKIEWKEEEFNPDRSLSFEYDLTTRKRRQIPKLTDLGPTYEDFMGEGLSRADSPKFPVPYERSFDDFSYYYLEGFPEIREVDGYWEDSGEVGTSHLFFERGGKRVEIFDDEIFAMEFFRAARPDTDWVVTSGMFSTAGHNASLFLADWKAGKARRIASDCVAYGLSSDEKIWTGHEGDRPLSNWGPTKRVWTCKLFAGDMAGKRWTVTSGLVFCVDSAMRPGFKALK